MKLRWSLVARGMRAHQQLQNKLEQKIRKLEMHLEHFPEDAVLLNVCLERHPKGIEFVARVTLRVPSNMLHAEKRAADPIPAFDQAIKAILRERAVRKAALRHESDWKRIVPQGFLPMMSTRADTRARVR